jgi:23S rRNA (pseudouridine1915-N3)-methyltransferase
VQVTIIAIGRIKERFLQEGIAEYGKRLRPYAKLQVIELADEKRPASASVANETAAIEKEGERICAAIPAGSFTVALDRAGASWSSETLACAFRDWELSGQSHVTFVIGGDLGLSPSVLSRCNLKMSLSKMTFTHPMARLILLEQVYRAFRILKNEPYHK